MRLSADDVSYETFYTRVRFEVFTAVTIQNVVSGMWGCIDRASTDVSEERISSIFRVEKSASGEPASAGGCRLSHQSETTSYIRTGTEGVLTLVPCSRICLR
jgi:hypothetical protein